MPQMAPYNWLILFILFNMMLMFYISNNHFHPYYLPPKESFKTPFSKIYIWKW